MENKTIIDDVNVRECEQSSYDCDVNGNPVTRIKCKRRYQDRIYFCDEFENCYFKQLKRAEQENKRLLEIINAKPLETVDIDCAFEIAKLKEQLQAKEQKIESLKANLNEIVICDKKLKEMLDTKEQECEKLKKEKGEVREYLGISNMNKITILQQLIEDARVRAVVYSMQYRYEQALDEIENYQQRKR